MDCNKCFSKNYALFNQEEASLIDLFRILFFSDINKRNFVDCPSEKVESFSYRWIIFVSIFAQKSLQFVAKPMAWFGSVLETWLNLVNNNHNIFVLLQNFIQGKVVWADKNSEKFISFTGHLDKRVELDNNIKRGDKRFYAALSMMASKASYENRSYIESTVQDHWQMEFLDCFDFYNEYQGKATTQACMIRDKNIDSEMIIVAFRGTETYDADAWCTDFDLSWYELHGIGKVHVGFMKALGLQKNTGWPKQVQRADKKPAFAYYEIREMLKNILQNNDKARFIVTGHSLGGALAILFPAILAIHEEGFLLERLEGVYTFGQPRVGDEKFGDFMKEQLMKYSIPYYRFVYGNDIVPRLPYDGSTLMFKHFGTCIYYNSFYKGKVVLEEPNKNYISPIYIIPKIINAIWELIRSFIIPYSKGPEYKEGSVLRVLRLIGLIIPGIPAHMPQDYVNSTRSEFCSTALSKTPYSNHAV